MGRLLIITIAYIAMIAVNAAANILPLNGQTTGEISDSYSVLFTPAKYVFSIWGFIYIILAYWIYKHWQHRQRKNTISIQQTLFFTASSLLNILWIFFWHYSYFKTSVVVMLLLLACLALLYFSYSHDRHSCSERIPISIYFAWISIATFTNIAFVFTYNHWSGLGFSDPLWTVIMLTFGTAIALHIRFHHFDITYPIVFIWAYIGIAMKNGFEELLVTTAALFLSGVLLAGILFIKKQKEKS
ncbi:tryptophan-rich sensory protein [Viridibacillus sp. YIM B01967]|uniref:Tryptophan-rich sensory protein n=1 Tax=Viridibacillus soli TaxID=2798301 RepID=A0ABS1H8N5_9BACL|nr:tryptophan-rich sensory protein [Viridibacillus soli]MBK3495780.1 tryptophan-rich sensory protein [Viridibacillus soli]